VPLGEVLLTPTRIYALHCLALVASTAVRAFAHVTGGGLAANLARVLPAGVEAVVERGSWTPPPVFGLVARLGQVPRADLERTLNLGVGMLAVTADGRADDAVRRLAGRGVRAWVAGRVEVRAAGARQGDGDVTRATKGVDGGAVRMVGQHPDA
jgi:phosphoribosylformylglycinamidine cyclo-ligase